MADKLLYKIDDFSGGIRTDVAADDVPKNACVECSGLEISKKGGALVRSLGWDTGTTLGNDDNGDPLVGTPVKAWTHLYPNPDGPKEVTFLATYDSTNSKPYIYMRPWWDASTPGSEAWDTSGTWKNIYDYYDVQSSFPLRWTELSGQVCDHLMRDDVLRVGMGVENFGDWPVWFGFVKNKMLPTVSGSPHFYIGQDTSDTTNPFNSFMCSPAPLLAPAWYINGPLGYSISGIYVTAELSGDTIEDYEPTMPAGEYYFAASFVYDGYQEGPLGKMVGVDDSGPSPVISETTLSLDSDGHIQLYIYVPWDTSVPPGPSPYFRPCRRWTAIRIYMKAAIRDPARRLSFLEMRAKRQKFEEGEIGAEGDWFLLAHIPLTERFDAVTGGIEMDGGWTAAGLVYPTALGTALNAYKVGIKLRELEAITGPAYWDSAGTTDPHPWHLWQYKRIGEAGGNIFYGNISEVLTDSVITVSNENMEADNSIRWAARNGYLGVVSPDMPVTKNFIGIKTSSGEGPIQGYSEVGGKIAVLQEHSISELRTSSVTGFVKKDVLSQTGVGLYAPNTLIKRGDAIVFASEGAVHTYDGIRLPPISKPLTTWWDTLTPANKAIATAGHLMQNRQYWLGITGADAHLHIYVYDFDYGAWVQAYIEEVHAASFFSGSDQRLYFITSTEQPEKIYQRYVASDASPYYMGNVLWTSGDLDFGEPNRVKRYIEMYVLHNSAVAMDVNIWVDGTAIGPTPTQLTATSAARVDRFHLYRTKGKRIKAQLQYNTRDQNPIEISEIGFLYDIRSR